MIANEAPLRILMVCELWQGSNSYAFARAFRRQGHSVSIVSEEMFAGVGWRSKPLKVARRLLMPMIRADYNRELLRQAHNLQPHLFFVCKGVMVRAETVQSIKRLGASALLWFPDPSMFAHGAEIPQAVPFYDWIFTTKTFGIDDMRQKLGVTTASFMPHAFDPETHRPFPVDADDIDRLTCDVSFIGSWTPKKEALIKHLARARPGLNIKIWGGQWEKAEPGLRRLWQSHEIFGAEYAKAIGLTKINLGILREIQAGGADGDRITSRTFHIPAAGGFMLHERSVEIPDYFVENRECAYFSDASDMIEMVDYFLANADQRRTIAEAGHQRCLTSGYSLDDRARTVLAKFSALRREKLSSTISAPIDEGA